MNVPFIDLQQHYRKIKPQADKALKDVFKRGDFILGQDVRLFEQEFAAYCGSRFALGVASGTDALFLSLKALGIGPGDEVIVPDFTFIATAFAVSYCGATPVFVDVDEKTCCIDPQQAAKAVTPRTRVIIPVHLFGQCAPMQEIIALATQHGLKVVEDACQSHGAQYLPLKRRAGAMGHTGCFSFYPTKNLGSCGDGGMIVTDDEQLYQRLYRLRDCGRKTRYEHSVIGYNSRLDTLQAALLRLKLRKLDAWNTQRQLAAACYDRLFMKAGLAVQLPSAAAYSSHVFHVYSIRLAKRDLVAAYLREHGIGVMVNYPVPLHSQEAYAAATAQDCCPVAARLCSQILSLPMYPGITKKQITYVVKTIGEALHAV